MIKYSYHSYVIRVNQSFNPSGWAGGDYKVKQMNKIQEIMDRYNIMWISRSRLPEPFYKEADVERMIKEALNT